MKIRIPKIPDEIEITKRHIGVIAVIALLCIGYAVIDTETLTLHAYYPSPVGIYTRLVSLNKATFAREKGNVVLTSERNPTGMVGIGTTDPQAKLDVRGEIKTNSRLQTERSIVYKPLSSLPATDVKKGELVYYDSDDSFYHYNGSDWVKQSGSDGGVCFTYYCQTVVGGGGRPCVDNGGIQKHCPAGFEEKYDLGAWGGGFYDYQFLVGVSHFMPPGGGCVSGYMPNFRGFEAGKAYLCCQ